MADPSSDTDDDAGPDHGSTAGTPRWVKVFGIVAIILVLLFVILHLTGNSPGHTPPPSVTEHGVQPP